MNLFHMFPGGIHPHEGLGGKKATSGLPVVELPQPPRVIIPLQQNIGSPCKCLVKKGDTVRVGQMIGEPVGPVSAAVHASVSGTVAACEPCLLPNGNLQDCVIIHNDFQDTWAEHAPVPNPESLTGKQLADLARSAGLVGMGGAMFPYGIKLNLPENKKVDTLLINGAECEPYLSADHRMMVEHATEVMKGATLIQKVLGIQRIIVGIENNKSDAIAAMKSACEGLAHVQVVSLPVRYPQGGEKQLVYALTKRVVKMCGLPLDVGVLVSNVASCYALYQAIYEGKPLVERIVTVGGLVNHPANYLVRIGTPVEWLINTSEGLLPQTRMLVYGGPMMGLAISRQDIPVIKGCSGILALEKGKMLQEESPCIRCGRCVNACPVKLAPALIDLYMRSDRFEDAEKAHVLNCMECGICSYSCPSRRNLTQSCKVCKKIILQKQRDAKKGGN